MAGGRGGGRRRASPKDDRFGWLVPPSGWFTDTPSCPLSGHWRHQFPSIQVIRYCFVLEKEHVTLLPGSQGHSLEWCIWGQKWNSAYTLCLATGPWSDLISSQGLSVPKRAREELARSVAFKGWPVDPWGSLRPFQGYTRSKLFSDNTKALLVFLTELMFALKVWNQ